MNKYAGILLTFLSINIIGCISDKSQDTGSTVNQSLKVVYNEQEATITVFREGEQEALVVHHAKKDMRPYLHPIKAPDGDGVLTNFSPGHHTHQTGLYWGFTRVNGRDYFHHPGADYWQRVSADVFKAAGDTVVWQTTYNLLDERGDSILTEKQTWSLTEKGGKFLLNLEWTGKAQKDVTIGEYDYGGLFLRMPWRKGIEGEVVNAAGLKNKEAEGQQAIWVDVGMEIEGRSDWGHIAIFDHSDNTGAPLPWRVDGQMGVGPVRARLGDWKIKQGETETIHHQVVVYTGQRNDIKLTKLWEQYTGKESKYAQAILWEQAQQEGRDAEFLTPDQAARAMTLPDEFEVNAWAGDSLVTQPMAFAWDNKGRIWVAENLDYESRQTGFSGSGESRIIILEDTNNDGQADKRNVFIEGIPFPSALEVGFGGVFVGAPPHLLFIPDRNKDDIADKDDIEIRLTGWGIRDRHEVINSFHWGPDGWLYGLEGFATSSKIRKPAGDARLYKSGDSFPDDLLEDEGTQMNGGVWRYHPVKDRFEVVAHGFSNPWGIDYNAKGEMFITACVIPHMFEVIQGGYYQRQGGQHYNPYLYDDIGTIVDHRHRSAHGGARIYQSDAFPEEHHRRLFMANIHEHAILSDKLTRKGSGYVASHGQDFMKANNAQFVGFSMEIGPGGNLYTLDWHDGDICGKEVLDANTGRIFRISPQKSFAENWEGRYSDLEAMSDKRLAEMQERNSNWHARRARLILQHRAARQSIDEEAQTVLWELFNNPANMIDHRLRGLWALHVTGLLNQKNKVQALQDNDEYVRGWAITLLAEDKTPNEEAREQFTQMARDDSSSFVRKQLASALQRIDYEDRWDIIKELIQHSEDADDHNIPKMIWFGLEPLVGQQPQRAVTLASYSKIRLITNHIARRVVDAESLEIILEGIGRNSSNPQVQLHLLEGMQDGLEGQNEQTAPPNWDQLYRRLQQSEDEQIKTISRRLAQHFGDAGAAQESFAILMNNDTEIEKRRNALQTMADQKYPKLLEQIPTLLDVPGLSTAAIYAIAEYEHEPLGSLIIKRYDKFNESEKFAAIQALASRPEYGWMLTEALQDKSIPKADVPPYVARQLKRVVGSGFMEIWGQPLDQDEEHVDTQMQKYEQLLTESTLGKANIRKGKLVFENTCAPCHKMFGKGGEVGPDLTGSNRTSVAYILFHVLKPDAVVQDAYKMVVVNMRDGQTYSGTLIGESEKQITLQLVARDPVVLNKSAIQSLEKTKESMMPPNLFNNLSNEEVVDLVRYLQTAGLNESGDK